MSVEVTSPAKITQVCLTPKVVIKTGPPSGMKIEHLKTVLARDIALKSGLFRVPEVVDFLPESGRLELKRIHQLVPFEQALNGMRIDPNKTYDVGVVLAVIHQELSLPPEMRISIPEHLDHSGSSKVFVHGDFTVMNVCLCPPDSELVITDWHMTDCYGDAETYGTPYFDVAWFLNSLFYRLISNARVFPRLPELARSFLRGYFGRDWPNRREDFGEYLAAFVPRRLPEQRKGYSWRSRLAYAPAEHLFMRFAKTLSSDISHE